MEILASWITLVKTRVLVQYFSKDLSTLHSFTTCNIALLTTEPRHTQKPLVVSAFLIERAWDDPGAETWVYGDKTSALDDMLQYEVEFWRYHKNPGNLDSTAWATGLFRYVSDVAVLGILEEYISKKSSQGGDIRKAEELLTKLKAKNLK